MRPPQESTNKALSAVAAPRDDYYGELASHPSPARAVGWESVEAQAARFEVVRRHIRPADRVLDLGAGLGDLGRHLARAGVACDYLGVERDPRLVARGHTMAPAVELREADIDQDPSAALGDHIATHGPGRVDVVAALGVLVDGRSLRSDGVRFGRLRRLLSILKAYEARVALLVVLDQDRLEAHPVLSHEPALGGIRRAEIAWLAPGAEVTPLLELELALVLRR